MTKKPLYEVAEKADVDATIRVTVAPEDVAQGLRAVYRRYANDARVPGFRKGHVPASVLDARFGREFFLEETKEDLVQHHVPRALAELGLNPVSRPKVEIESFDEGQPFVFRTTFAVLPEIDLPSYQGLDVEIPRLPEIGDQDVERALQEVQSQFATLVEKPGEIVTQGDIVRVREGESEWDTRAEAEHPATGALVGASVGHDVEIDAELPDGKRLKTTLHVVSLREIETPDIDDELAKDAGFESLSDLKDDLRKKLEDARGQRRDQLIEGAALSKVVAAAQIPLPEAFVEELLAEEIERAEATVSEESGQSLAEALAEQGMSEEDYRNQIQSSIERRLRNELVIRKIAAEEGISVSDEELQSIAQAEAERTGENPLRFVARLKAEDRWDDFRAKVVNQRVLGLLRESATVREIEQDDAKGRIIDPSRTRSGDGLVIDPSKEGTSE